ncbi:MAG: hypothetical protein L7U87_02210 [Chlamydiales bacterium]|nr:hypothetical protein [Chlamydiales bacterium]
MLAHIKEYYPLFEFPLSGYKSAFDRYERYLEVAGQLASAEDKATSASEVFFRSSLQPPLATASLIIESLIPFLSKLLYPTVEEEGENPIIEAFKHSLIYQVRGSRSEEVNSILLMIQLDFLEESSTALEIVKDEFIRTTLTDSHRSLTYLEEAFAYLQELKAQALTNLQAKAHQERMTEEFQLQSPVAVADSKEEEGDELTTYSPSPAAIISEMRVITLTNAKIHALNSLLKSIKDRLEAFLGMKPLSLEGLKTALGDVFTAEQLEEISTTIVERLKTLDKASPRHLDRSDSPVSSSSSLDHTGNEDDIEPSKILDSLLELDENELKDAVKIVVLDVIRKKAFEASDITRIYEAIESRALNFTYHYTPVSGKEKQPPLPLELDQEASSTLFRTLLRVPIQQLYSLFIGVDRRDKRLLGLPGIYTLSHPHIKEEVTRAFSETLRPFVEIAALGDD